MKTIESIAITLVIIGAINWGLIGLFDFNLVELIFGSQDNLITKIIYIADGIEPNRDYEGVERIRETVFEDIDRALILQIDSTLKSVISRGGLIHPNTIDTRNFYLKKLRWYTNVYIGFSK
mgnify:CR=1 FL=1